jgi:hypothetical protein
MLDIFALFGALLAHRAWNPPPLSSLPEEQRLTPSSSMRRRAIPDARSAYAGRRCG